MLYRVTGKRESKSIRHIKKYVDYENNIDSSALFPISSRPTSNDHVLLLESEHACGDTLSCQIIVFVKVDKVNGKCAEFFEFFSCFN